MKQIFKRIIAGTSAVILSLSAVGTDAFTNMFAGIVSAEDTNRKGKSTGFTNLEQDTSGEYYNTGYGLHTNKTATALADGRTFDVNLESWYVGENPVDVATILDASGSMAWTVDTLDPMKVSEQLTDEEIETLKSKYGTDDLTAIQNANGGYLPQDVVDLILDPTKTDNTKLEYDGYKYYVYEGRSTVSEFVPLGYWDGGTDPKTDPALIGYYPFSGDLKNKAPNAEKDATGILINHPDSGGVYDPNTPATKKIEGVFGTGEKKENKETVTYIKGLNIADSASKGAIKVASPSTEKFSISFEMSVDDSADGYDDATILYLTDGTNSYRLYRAGGSSGARLKMSASKGNAPLNANQAVNTEPRKWTFTFDFSGETQTLYIETNTKNTKLDNKTVSTEYSFNLTNNNCPTLDTSKLQIYIGGNTTEPTKKVNNIYIRNLSISEYQTETVTAAESVALPEIFEPETVPATEEVTEPETLPTTEEVTEPETVAETEEVTEPETEPETEGVIELETIAGPEPLVIAAEEEKVIAKYPLTKDLSNTTTPEEPAKFVYQLYESADKAGTEIESLPLEPVFKESKYLDVKSTSQNGAVRIDAVPEIDDDGFTISMKLSRNSKSLKDSKQNIFYLGDSNKNNSYYQFFRSAVAGGYLGLANSVVNDLATKPPTQTDMVYYQGGMQSGKDDEDVWYTNTLVFETNPENTDQYIVTPYINGKAEYQKDSVNNFTINKISVDENLVFLLGALKKNGDNDSKLYLDDLYVFDKALSGDKVSLYFGDNTISCDADGTTHAVSYIKDNKGNFEKNEDGTFKTIEIAQISNGEKRLGQNKNFDQRRGWYYVNSNSNWKDIEGCLASGKEYIGIFTDIGIDDYPDMVKDTATEPNGYKYEDKGEILKQIAAGNNEHADYKPPTTERSIRFYVDSQNHLRCFVWSGNDSKKEDDKRTFCSLVYEKQDKQKTKYEELNNALNTFYSKIAEKSDLTNSAVVRFSTDKLLAENPDENLKRLIMKDWINRSDVYQAGETDKNNYLQNLLIPENESKTATDTNDSLTRGKDIQEYPYVMTGGTYTWTGLKAFYDNMVKKDGLESGDRVYDVANNARDKYLIIFTDGRDNTQDYEVVEEDDVSIKLDAVTKDNYDEFLKANQVGSPDYNDKNISNTTFGGTKYVNAYNPYAGTSHKVGFSIVNYNNPNNFDSYTGKMNYPGYQIQQFKTEDHEIATDGDLAEAWADKLKDEGYTIYCVMLATGSISEYANKAEYDKAYNFLKSLAGGKDVDEEIAEKQADMDSWDLGIKPDEYARVQTEIEALKDNYVMVVDPSKGGASSLEDAFEEILEQIQQPRNDYIVQDYIDPRFDLIGKAYTRNEGKYEPIDVIYHLGAGGEITFTDTNNNPIESENGYIYFDNGGYKTSYEISKLKVTVGNRIDNIDKTDIVRFAYTPITTENISGTGYIYYDNVKDMYYLRWENQVIPMTDKSFDTASEPDRHLNVWSATIRLKAKDDFIGGNNILTNGNEAGENLVYSDATIDNMEKNPELYFGDKTKRSLREKLELLSGANRKINAIDADGVSQAIYGDGIDIPSSGFPRTTVNVKLLPLNAKNLNDVIYMGEVISPTMMLADLENDYMTGSYYLEYLERYAYRLYGYEAGNTPLIELLNRWLKINEEDETAKTFTIPYIYLPDPEYDENGKLVTEGEKVKIQNSTGWDSSKAAINEFDDLNLRDVTGFITYTWKRDDTNKEPQQLKDGSTDEYDITKEYIVKNTNQIKYNLQLTFTPLKEGDLTDFKLDNNFIEGEKFFNIQENEFNDEDVSEWTFTNRADYLKAMVDEKKNYTLYADYNDGKLTLLSEPEVKTNENVYDWDTSYKPVAGNVQIENDLTKYTNTLNNVGFADKDGNTITDKTGAFIEGKSAEDVYSLVANTTYIKDVVNGALALELVVDGKYLLEGSEINPTDGTKTYTFEATRYYDDPIDPLPYGDKTSMNADTGEGGKKYQLTFTVDEKTLPEKPQANQFYTVWAKLTNVAVENGSEYKNITDDGYEKIDALPIGTYEIKAAETSSAENDWNNKQFKIADSTTTGAGNLRFQYLKTDNTPASYTYNRFPDSVYNVSKTAPESTGDRDYLIKDGAKDNSKKNIAESSRYADLVNNNNQKITFYFGTVEKESGGNEGKKGKTDPENNYTKDRLGIILLSADSNSLAISKTVTYTEKDDDLKHDWEFTITFKPDTAVLEDFTETNGADGFALKWYKLDDDGKWVDESGSHDRTIKFTLVEDGDYSVLVGDDYIHYYKYTATLKLKHNEKVLISELPEGTWQVTETDETKGEDGIFYSAHNNMDDVDEYEHSISTSENIELNPNSHVDFINEFPHALPSAGGTGGTDIDITLYCSIMLVVAAALYFTKLFSKKCKISDEQKS